MRTPADEPLESGAVIDGLYELVGLVGAGGLGQTWACRRRDATEGDDALTALRVLHGDLAEYPEARAALEHEYHVARALDHPNILRPDRLGFDEIRGIAYVELPLLRGSTLAEVLREQPAGGMDLARAWRIATQVGAALGYVHGRGLVHSDFKPAKLFVEEGDLVLLRGFGLARPYRAEDGWEFEAGVLGALAPSYASVEMFDGNDPDPTDDIYAFGVTLYQLLGGEHPYQKRPAPKARELALVPESVGRLTRRQNRALQRAVAFEAAQRTASIAALMEELRPRGGLLARALGALRGSG